MLSILTKIWRENVETSAEQILVTQNIKHRQLKSGGLSVKNKEEENYVKEENQNLRMEFRICGDFLI